MDEDGVSKITWEKLLSAAERGVKITYAVDAIKNGVSKSTLNKFRKLGGTYIKYNRPWRFLQYFAEKKRDKMLSRHHEKLIMIDDTVFVGSGNMTGEYGGPELGKHIFNDIYMEINKAPTRSIIEFMNKTVDKKDAAITPKLNENMFPTDKFNFYKDEDSSLKFYYQAPRLSSDLRLKLLKLIQKAKHKIVIINPYVQLIPLISTAILEARRRGVKVEIVTAREKDLIVYNYIPNYILFKKFIDAGCEVYEYKKTLLHTKLYIIDNKHFSLGSFNHDFTASYCNTECNIVYSTKSSIMENPIFDELASIANEVKKYSDPVYLETDEWKFTKDWFKTKVSLGMQWVTNHTILAFNPEMAYELNIYNPPI